MRNSIGTLKRIFEDFQGVFGKLFPEKILFAKINQYFMTLND
jgi:hypothetical protein